MARPPYGDQSSRDRSICDTHESLEALVRLLARQLARKNFARSTQQNQSKDQSSSSNTGSEEHD